MQAKQLREPLYDTYVVAAAASPTALGNVIQFFAAGKSATKGIEKTNLNDDGMLPSPESIVIGRPPRISFLGMVIADVVAICKAYVVRLSVNGSAVFTAPLEYCPAGGGVVGDAQNGIASAEALVSLPDEFAIVIESGQKFVLELVTSQGTGPTPTASGSSGTGVFMRAMLDGLHTLPLG